MKVVFITNFYNHHQAALSRALYQMLEGNFAFIQTQAIPKERVALGYAANHDEPFLYDYTLQKETCDAWLEAADVLIFGQASMKFLRPAAQRKQIVLHYSERPLKDGPEWHKYLPRLLKWRKAYARTKRNYLLAAGAYTAKEYRRFLLYRHRAYVWGYFPDTYRYDAPESLVSAKDKTSILWCGRLLDWKHPDDALAVASRLKKEGYQFNLTFVGGGDLETELLRRISQEGLEAQVRMVGAVAAEKVRNYMERAGIFLMTSDAKEGWGVVLNEAMNSGCAVVASHAAGGAPVLLRQNGNGYLYPSGNTEALYERVKYLLDHPVEQERLGLSAYRTVTEHWNAETAAERLLTLIRCMMDGDTHPMPYTDGICSPALLLSEKDQAF